MNMKNTESQSDKKDNLKNNFHNVFLENLKETYNSEKTLLASIPNMIINADSEELVEALNKRLEFTRNHINRLEETFYSLRESEIIKKPDAI
jgi:ferritin-like metal-binding protein YciE